eukprot:s140_g38.t1
MAHTSVLDLDDEFQLLLIPLALVDEQLARLRLLYNQVAVMAQDMRQSGSPAAGPLLQAAQQLGYAMRHIEEERYHVILALRAEMFRSLRRAGRPADLWPGAQLGMALSKEGARDGSMAPVTPPRRRARSESHESRDGPSRDERTRRDSEGPPARSPEGRRREGDGAEAPEETPRTASQEAEYQALTILSWDYKPTCPISSQIVKLMTDFG